MRRVEGNRLTQIVQRLLQRLVRQTVHQVEVEAAQAEAAGETCCALGLLRAVDPPQALQLRFAKALYADGDAVHPGALIINEAIGLHGTRVGFHGDFRPGGQRQAGADAIQQGLHGRAGQQARRTAADKNSAYFPSLGILRISLQIVQQMLDVVIMRHLAFQRMRIKIAVRAFLHAPGNMDIETQRRQISHYVMLPVTVSAPARDGKWRSFLHGSVRPRFSLLTGRRRSGRNRSRHDRRLVG